MKKKKTRLFMLIAIVIPLAIMIILYGCDGGGDITAPAVISTDPADGSTKVLINTGVSMTFNEAIDNSTLTEDTFTLSLSVVGSIKQYDVTS